LNGGPRNGAAFFVFKKTVGGPPAYNRVEMHRLKLRRGIVAAVFFLTASGVRGEAQRQTDESDAVRTKATAEFGPSVAPDIFCSLARFQVALVF
jgi:hypothetical protein